MEDFLAKNFFWFIICALGLAAVASVAIMGCSLIVDGEKEDGYESYLDDSDYDEDTSGGIGSHDDSLGGTDTGVATSIDSVSSTQAGTGVVEETVSETISEADTVSASESISSSASGTGVETTSEVTSESVSETVSETEDTGEDDIEICVPESGLCWEYISKVDAPKGASYSTLKFRCEKKGMRIPTAQEVRTLLWGCEGFFLPGCDWSEANGYDYCVNPNKDTYNCHGPTYQDETFSPSVEYIITSSSPTDYEGKHVEWYLSLDRHPQEENYPRVYPRDLVVGVPQIDNNFKTLCVR